MNNFATSHSRNPFPTHESDRREIWEILMRRDFEAFVAGDWSTIQDDFWQIGFCGIDARKQSEPSQWQLRFPTVAAYRDEWLRQVNELASTRLVSATVLDFLYEAFRLDGIEIVLTKRSRVRSSTVSPKAAMAKTLCFGFKPFTDLCDEKTTGKSPAWSVTCPIQCSQLRSQITQRRHAILNWHAQNVQLEIGRRESSVK